MITDAVVVTREYALPQAKTSGEIIAFYAQVIAQSLKLPSQFAALVPKIEQFLREKAYGQAVNLDSAAILQDLNRPLVLLFEEKTPVASGQSLRLSATPLFPWSGKIADVKRTVFNVTPCDNDFEQSFAHFLDGAPDIEAFANLGNLRQYEPYFVARTADGTHWLLETKGREDADVVVELLGKEV